MQMFIETDSHRLQNLFLLQDVRAMENEETDPVTYSVAYVQSNGMIIKEGQYDSFEDADEAAQNIKNILIGANSDSDSEEV